MADRFNFSDNLMFEWGFITATYRPEKVHVFLINVPARELPTDLAGAWATEIQHPEADIETLADEILEIFMRDASHPIELDKLQIMHEWSEIIKHLELYNRRPDCSDLELAHYILHSMETCYYRMEEERFERLLRELRPASGILERAVRFARANIRLFRETNGLQSALPLDSFVELRALFEGDLDIGHGDLELTLWFRYFSLRRLSILYHTASKNTELSSDDCEALMRRALRYLSDASDAVSTIVDQYPQQLAYSRLFQGFVSRDESEIHKLLGETDAAVEASARAMRCKQQILLDYEAKFPQDTQLIGHLREEYLLSLAESLEYFEDPAERSIAKKTIEGFLSKLELETGRRHVVLEVLRSKFGK